MTLGKQTTVIVYATVGTLAAIALVYVFSPTLFPEDLSSRTKAREGAVGLGNPANDCFINSVLQALAGLKDLKHSLSSDFLDTRDITDHEDVDVQTLSRREALEYGIVSKALADILHELSERSASRKTLTAKAFIRTLEYAYGNMINRRQQDAQEFLQLLLERLTDERRVSSPPVSSQQGKTVELEDTNIPFEGCTTSEIQCSTCHYKPTPTTTSFAMLSLSVPHTAATTIDTCLDGLLKSEVIDGYKCSRCTAIKVIANPHHPMERDSNALSSNARAMLASIEASLATDAAFNDDQLEDLKVITSTIAPTTRISKHTYISRYPAILILHLSRSVFDATALSLKNNARVSFPEVLVLGGFNRKYYHLATMITHRGGHNSGHYETFRRQFTDDTVKGKRQKHRKSSKWWRISDDHIAECTTADVLAMQKEVYLLFYELMEAP